MSHRHSIAAVVMAGGLGPGCGPRCPSTSTDPRPPHGRLGDRGGPRDGRRSARRRRLADRQVTSSPTAASTVAVQEPPLGTGDAVRDGARALGDHAGDVLVLSGDTPLLTPELLRELVETHHREGAAATILGAEPPEPGSTAGSSAAPTAPCFAIAEGTDATSEERAIREINSSIYVFRPTSSGPRSSSSSRRTSRASSISPTRSRSSSPAARRSPRMSPPIDETDGVNTRVELARGRRGSARPDQRGAHARGRHDRRSRDDLDRADGRDRARRDDPAVHDPARGDAGRGRRGDRREHRRGRRAHRRSARRSAPSVTFAPGRSSASLPRQAPSWRSRTQASATGQRCRTCPTSAMPRSARTRTSAQAQSPPTSRISRACPRAGRRSAATSGPRSTMASLRR